MMLNFIWMLVSNIFLKNISIRKKQNCNKGVIFIRPFFDILVLSFLRRSIYTYEEKKILASLLLSTVLVSQGAVLSSVQANTTDEKNLLLKIAKLVN